MPSARGLTGAAGEYYVAAELSRRDWLATVTIKNSPGTDVLAQRRDRQRIIAIQTKTASPGSAFTLTSRDENPGERDNEWYVLVSLGDLMERPQFYVVPRHVVAAFTYLSHREWLANTGRLLGVSRAGHIRRDSDRRSIRPQWLEGYSERWDLLDLPAWEAPFLGEPVFRELARDLGLPAGCPPLSPRRRRGRV